MILSEAFVQFVWKFGLFDQQNLFVNEQERVQIISFGTHNHHGGPDFFNAKIYLGETLWIGNVEIHLSNKHWYQHQHQLDPAYNNVILHVVFEGSCEDVELQNGRTVPTISIGKLIYHHTLENFKNLLPLESNFIPCQHAIEKVDSFVLKHTFEALLVERLERKVQEFEAELELHQGDLEMALVVKLFKYFGAPKNKDAFEILARSLNLKLLSKQSCSKEQMESFLFGMADLLNDQDIYAVHLANEFQFVKQKFRLRIHCKKENWHFAGVRPPSFPTLRIAQLAAILSKNIRLSALILEIEEVKPLRKLFELEVSSYWHFHYNFTVLSQHSTKNLSLAFIDKIIINVVVPFLFFYGKYIDEERFCFRALDLMTSLKPEENQIVKGFSDIGITCANAAQSQALIELKTKYCERKNCLNCRLGYDILKKDSS